MPTTKPAPPPPPMPASPEEMAAWRHMLRARIGAETLSYEPPNPSDVQAGLARIAAWGAPDYFLATENVPLPPPEEGTVAVTVYVYASPEHPAIAVRALDARVASDTDRIIGDLQSAWVRASQAPAA